MFEQGEKNQNKNIRFIRYPGGKQMLITRLLPFLPPRENIKGTFVEPFVGGGAVFFATAPYSAILSDINPILIEMYRGLKYQPKEIWKVFKSFPSTKRAFYTIRNQAFKGNLVYESARTLYLNRTCFKGMWRQNSNGDFNVGYGGQDRRWVVNESTLCSVSRLLKKAELFTSDFELVIDTCNKDDFIFLDPPYKLGGKELLNDHYVSSKFSFDDHIRLAKCLKRATRRKIKWAMTTSSHPEILKLFKNDNIIWFLDDGGMRKHRSKRNSGQVLICNY